MKSKILWILLAVFVVILSGCHTSVQDTATFNKYYMTTLNVTTSSDVISMFQDKDEVLVKSSDAIASWGKAKEDTVIWFNAVAFDDETSRAVRKYAFVTNTKAKGYGVAKVQTLRFDAALVINPEVFTKPYSNDDAMKKAVMESVLEDFGKDLQPLSKESRTLNSAKLMVKQLLKRIIYDLNASPSIAQKLDRLSGLEFEHPNYGPGRIRMIVDKENQTVKLKAMTGSTIKDFDKKLDIVSM